MGDLQIEEDLARARLDRHMAGRMVALLRPVIWRVLAVVAVEIVLVFSIFLRPLFIRLVIDKGMILTSHGWILVPAVITWCMLGLVLVWLIRFGIGGFGAYLSSMVAIRVLNDLRVRVFAHVQSLSISYFDRTKAGRIIARADRDVDSLEPAIINGPPEILGISLRSIGAGLLLYSISHRIFWMCAPLLPLLGLAMALFQRCGSRVWGAVAEAKSRVTAHLCETISGVRVIQQHGFEQVNSRRYDNLLLQLDRASVRGTWAWGWFGPYSAILFTAGLSILLVEGGVEVADHRITVGELAQAMFYLSIFLGPLQELGDLYEKIATGAAAAQRIFLLLDSPIEIRDHPEATALTQAEGAVTFDHVRFSYDPHGQLVIKDLSLIIPAGQRVAIVGPTGHGKSTLVQLLTRFYQPQSGRILVDGRDISTITQESLRRKVSVVLQENILFTGSILENLRLARADATDLELIDATRDLGAEEVIRHLPNGYMTQVGQGGSNLSHGQRQIVCLIRAYLADPSVLVLDEATSGIDIHTERRLQRALKRLCAGRTAIVIAHRLATIRDADRIVVLEHGMLIEDGNHHTLMARGGRYAALYSTYEREQG